MTLARNADQLGVSAAISSGNRVFVHAWTDLMANPLACAALASLELWTESPWEQLGYPESGLACAPGSCPCTEMSHVEEVRCWVPSGVVELKSAVDMHPHPAKIRGFR